jgi:hypothetical protein
VLSGQEAGVDAVAKIKCLKGPTCEKSRRYQKWNVFSEGLAVVQAGILQRLPGFDPRFGHVGFVALEQVLSEYSGFPCQFLF